MWYTYIIYSLKVDHYYTGSTKNLDTRFRHHNIGSTQSTRAGAPEWSIVYSETYETRSEALKRERKIKKKKSRKYIEWLITSNC